MQAPTIRDYMTPSPVTIAADLTLAQARERMFRSDVRHLPVVDDGELVGILSQRDVALAEALVGDLERVPVREAMRVPAFTCGPSARLDVVAAAMAAHKYGAAVVVERDDPGRVIGVFTTVDALRALATLCRA